MNKKTSIEGQVIHLFTKQVKATQPINVTNPEDALLEARDFGHFNQAALDRTVWWM